MKFRNKLIKARLIKRYKRFLADVALEDGSLVTAHCANSGSMMGLKEEGSVVWLSPKVNPKNKLPYKWELLQLPDTLVGINTAHPNAIVEEAILNGDIAELKNYDHLKREVKYGTNSRIDILLSNEGDDKKCYVEVKSVTLKRGGNLAEFPDAVTARGLKHLEELSQMIKDGHRAVMIYLMQREDCTRFSIASDIDPLYAEAFKKALKIGVEAYCYNCKISVEEISLHKLMEIDH
jgi:sugar fermentation stimulation protein A